MTETFLPVAAKPGKHSRKKFRHEVRLSHLPEKHVKDLPTGEFMCELEFHFYQYTTGDIDNLIKPTLDVIKGSLLRDDRQIRAITAKLVEHSNKNGIQIKLTPIIAGEKRADGKLAVGTQSYVQEAVIDPVEELPDIVPTKRRKKRNNGIPSEITYTIVYGLFVQSEYATPIS